MIALLTIADQHLNDANPLESQKETLQLVMSEKFTINGSRDALWTATAVKPPDTQPLHEHLRCDVAIIGGGITGLNAAMALSGQGVSVCVLESSGLGFGASGRAGGQVNLGLNLGPHDLIKKFGTEQGERLIDLVIRTPDAVFKSIEENGLRCDPIQNGWIQGAITKPHLTMQEQLVKEYAKHGCQLDLLDKSAIAERVGTTRYAGGMHCPMAGSIQPLSYTRELATKSIEYGAKVFTDSKVTGIQASDVNNSNGWTLTTANGQIDSEQVLICTNGYTDNLINGLKQTVVPVRSILMASEPLSDNLRATVLPNQVTFVDKRRLILYFRYDRDGRLCVGDHGPMRDEFCRADYTHLKRRLLEVFPQLSNTRWDYHWGGRIAATKDSLPFIHQIAPGLTAAMGYNGRGVGMGTMVGKALAEKVCSPTNQPSAFPITTPKKFTMHKFHSAGVSMAIKWMALRDHLEST